MTYVLISRNYSIAFPKASQEKRTLMVLHMMKLYPNELRFAKMITVKDKLETGILTKRTI